MSTNHNDISLKPPHSYYNAQLVDNIHNIPYQAVEIEKSDSQNEYLGPIFSHKDASLFNKKGYPCGIDSEVIGTKSTVYTNIQNHESLQHKNTPKTSFECLLSGYKLTNGKGQAFSARVYNKNEDNTKYNRGEYISISYQNVMDLICAFSQGLLSLDNISPGTDETTIAAINTSIVSSPLPLTEGIPTVGIFSVNRPEWAITMYAAYTQRMTVVPLYTTLGTESIGYIIQNTRLPVIVVSLENFPQLVSALEYLNISENPLYALKHIIVMDYLKFSPWENTLDIVSDEMKQKCQKFGVSLHGYQEILEKGNFTNTNTLPESFVFVNDSKNDDIRSKNDDSNDTIVTINNEPSPSSTSFNLLQSPDLSLPATTINNSDITTVLNNSDSTDISNISLSSGSYSSIPSITQNSPINHISNTNIAKYSIAKPSDLAFIMYTSGTTGLPKGVMLCHSSITAAFTPLAQYVPISKQLNYYSYLPMAHIFEISMFNFTLGSGAHIFFTQGDNSRLQADLIDVHPHLIFGVPRVWERFYSGLWSIIANNPTLLDAYKQQLFKLRNNQSLIDVNPDGLDIDKTFFAPIRTKVGLDRIIFTANGSAPIPPHILEFFRVFLPHTWYTEGYGSTETCSIISVTLPKDPYIGHCGSPLNSLTWRLHSLPDMNRYHDGQGDNSNQSGELLVRGSNVFEGYYNNPIATKNAFIFDEKGRKWFRTNDVAHIAPSVNTISIIGRANTIIKLSQGEYVNIEYVETCHNNTSATNSAIAQLWVYGNSYTSYLVGIVVPKFSEFYKLSVDNKWWVKSHIQPSLPLSLEFIEECKNIYQQYTEEIHTWVMEELIQSHKTAKLNGLQKIKNISLDFNFEAIDGRVFTEKNGLLTPTLKICRPQLTKHYADVLLKLYSKDHDDLQISDIVK